MIRFRQSLILGTMVGLLAACGGTEGTDTRVATPAGSPR